MAKSAAEQLAAKKSPKKVVLEKNFAGLKKGQTMLVATPQLVAKYIRTIPAGKTSSVADMRADLAKAHGCDASCPMSTAIFVRIAAQAAVDELNEGAEPASVMPFWRVLSSDDKITRRLTIDADWLDHQRELERSG